MRGSTVYQVPWKEYSEEELQGILAFLFRHEGYNVYNAYEKSRRGKVTADLECTKPAETGKILIMVNKKPQQKDIQRLNTFARRRARAKIYVYIEEPSGAFREAMKRTSRVSFWDSRKLTSETFSRNLRFYLSLIIENHIERTSYRITLSFCRFYLDLDEGNIKVGEPAKADAEMLNLLWNAKDRSASLHKSLRTMQEIFENTDLSSPAKKTTESVVKGFLRGLFDLRDNSLRPLEILFSQFITRYPDNFAQFCIQTKGASNWIFFMTHVPELLPNHIIRALKKEEEESVKLKQFLAKTGVSFDSPDSICSILGDLSRITANGAYWLEDTIDDLLSIALFKEWTGMRERTPDWLRFWEYEHGLGYPSELGHAKTIDAEAQVSVSQQAQLQQPPKAQLMPLRQKLCFVLMPFKASFFRVYDNHIKPILERNGFEVMKADDIFTPTAFHKDVQNYIKRACLVLADVTNKNPNVLYELGFAHALGKDTIIITQNKEDVPSDFKHLRYFKYDDDEKGWKSLRVRLDKVVGSIKMARKL